MLLLGIKFPMSSTDVDDFSQEMDNCKNTNTNIYTKDCKHFFFGHTQDLYFSALGYETQSGMGFQMNWYYIAFIHWSSWSWLHLLLHLIDFQLSRQVASCGEGDLAR